MKHPVRPATAADLAELARLHALCFPDDRWDAQALSELLAMPGTTAHLVEEPGQRRAIGMMLDLLVAGSGEVLTLGVAPAVRRQGIARALLEDLFARAGGLGVKSLGLEVAADNGAARRLYERCGFTLTGQRRGYYRRGRDTVDALLFRRTLLD